ncbi:putative uncharacterized protein DDB_G0290521 [Nematostella vectensis]|uniref:putative uncharacterized protein DDB_G0290521 n=1 Tax=Nematostella vectensis TaxID=45351 RepID=UPI0020777CEE|nr:putative uncharacterized protein DDB_G0290521 [Nematostella vectensis]
MGHYSETCSERRILLWLFFLLVLYNKTESSCNKRYTFLSNNSFTITSPLWPSSPPSNTTCNWAIESSPNTYLVFQVQEIEVNPSSPCDHYLSFRLSSGEKSYYITKYCRLVTPTYIYSLDNYMEIEYHIGSADGISKGLKGTIHILQAMCTRVMVNDDKLSGVFATPNYPYVYPANINCTWSITVPKGYHIRLNLKRIWVPVSNNCASDHVTILDGFGKSARVLKVLCGHLSVPEVLSTGQFMQVTLYSDKRTTSHGFTGVYTAKPDTIQQTTLFSTEQTTQSASTPSTLTKSTMITTHPTYPTTDTPSPTQSTTDTPSPTQSTTDTPSPTQSTTDTPSPTQSTTDTPSPTQSTTDTPSPTQSTTDTPSPTQYTKDTPSQTQSTTDTPSQTQSTTDTPSPTQSTTDTPSPTQSTIDQTSLTTTIPSRTQSSTTNLTTQSKQTKITLHPTHSLMSSSSLTLCGSMVSPTLIAPTHSFVVPSMTLPQEFGSSITFNKMSIRPSSTRQVPPTSALTTRKPDPIPGRLIFYLILFIFFY